MTSRLEVFRTSMVHKLGTKTYTVWQIKVTEYVNQTNGNITEQAKALVLCNWGKVDANGQWQIIGGPQDARLAEIEAEKKIKSKEKRDYEIQRSGRLDQYDDPEDLLNDLRETGLQTSQAFVVQNFLRGVTAGNAVFAVDPEEPTITETEKYQDNSLWGSF